MHAASVNPEPGSNSLKNCISSTLVLKTFFRACLLVYFCLSSILKKLRDSSLHNTCLCFVLHLLLFNFQWPIRLSAFLGTAWILYHKVFLLSSTFFDFLKKFLKVFAICPFLKATRLLYHFHSVLSIVFLKIFEKILTAVSKGIFAQRNGCYSQYFTTPYIGM